jgi:very-short-patch-repair endonuclease
MDLRCVEPFATRHHGVVTMAAASHAGVSVASWYRAHDRGLLERLYPGVSRVVGSAPTRLQRLTAGVLAAGPDALASHRTAAGLWGIPRPETDPIDVILPKRQRSSHRREGIVVHRPRDRKDLAPANRASIPTTNVVRTLCDLGAIDPDAVPGAVGHVLSSRLATVATLDSGIARHSGRGRAGVVAFRNALGDWMLGGKPADSVLELAMRDIFCRFALPPVEFHAVIGGYEVDFRIVGTPILIECDGWATHGLDRRTFDRDRRRDVAHTAAGFVTLRFTYSDVVRCPAATARAIRKALVRWAPHTLVA